MFKIALPNCIFDTSDILKNNGNGKRDVNPAFATCKETQTDMYAT